jgi:hypothetical protein
MPRSLAPCLQLSLVRGVPLLASVRCDHDPDNCGASSNTLLAPSVSLQQRDGTLCVSRCSAAANVAFWGNPTRRMRPRRVLRAGAIRRRIRCSDLHREVGLLGACGAMQRRQARLDGRNWAVRMLEASASDARCPGSPISSCPHEPTARFAAFRAQ